MDCISDITESMDSLFFIASKMVWPLMAPANLLSASFILGWLAGFKSKKVRKFFYSAGLGVLLIFGILPMGHNTLHFLESRYQRVYTNPEKVTGILVLGGAIETRASAISGRAEFNDGIERVLAAIELSREYPNARIVFSGGSGYLLRNERKESSDMNSFLNSIGFDQSKVIYEDKSRNTWENIKNSKSKVDRDSDWILVTSAYHMPRAMGVAHRLKWDVIPYPVDYRSHGRYLALPVKFDVLDNLNAAHLSLREMIGWLAYRVTGKL